MRYQFAEVSKAVESQIRQLFAQCQGKEMCVPGAIRLMLCGREMPIAVFIPEQELELLEENGYDRHRDPYLLQDAVVLVMETSPRGQVRKRGIYEQGDLFEVRR